MSYNPGNSQFPGYDSQRRGRHQMQNHQSQQHPHPHQQLLGKINDHSSSHTSRHSSQHPREPSLSDLFPAGSDYASDMPSITFDNPAQGSFQNVPFGTSTALGDGSLENNPQSSSMLMQGKLVPGLDRTLDRPLSRSQQPQQQMGYRSNAQGMENSFETFLPYAERNYDQQPMTNLLAPPMATSNSGYISAEPSPQFPEIQGVQFDPLMQNVQPVHAVPNMSSQRNSESPMPSSYQQSSLQRSQRPHVLSQPGASHESPAQALSPAEQFLQRVRQKYKPKSSIPPDLAAAKYAEQCIAAARSSRLPPFALHVREYNLLRNHLESVHVTTYLNIRNGILRLWLANPMVNVTGYEAAGCVRDERYYPLAEFAFEFLVRAGYINYGYTNTMVIDMPLESPGTVKRPRMTIVVIGAGIAGLACARQLENLLNRYRLHFHEYEDIPRVLVLEGRRRIGGRIYSAPISSTRKDSFIDIGAQVIMGFGNGNPLGVLVRRQLGLPVIPIEGSHELLDSATGNPVDAETEERVARLFQYVMSKIARFRNEPPRPVTANGDEVLMRAARDPAKDDFQDRPTIGRLEESGNLPKPYDDPGEMEEELSPEEETVNDILELKKIGYSKKSSTPETSSKRILHLTPEPPRNPSLGKTIRTYLEQLKEIIDINEFDLRVLRWHFAVLEYSTGCSLDKLSLGSWDHDHVNRFTGRHCVIKDGFMSLARALYQLPDKLDVRFKTTAKIIDWDSDSESSPSVTLENGDIIECNRVAVTVPLGVLKARNLQFIPDLPRWKSDSMTRIGYGVTNKVVLIFDKEFWDPQADSISLISECWEKQDDLLFTFLNCTGVVEKPCLVGMATGNAADLFSGLSDEEIIDRANATLAKVLPAINEATLLESYVTRWQLDPFSFGSYSHLGVEATAADIDILARHIKNTIFFGGEATCRAAPGTVHGAYISGMRVANEILNSLIGEIELPNPLLPKNNGSERSSGNAYGSNQTSPPLHAPMQSNPYKRTFMSTLNTRGNTPAGDHMAPSSAHISNHPSPLPQNSSSGNGYNGLAGLNGLSSSNGTTGDKAKDSEESLSTIDREALAQRLKDLKEKRIQQEKEDMRNSLIKELGERPTRPERGGANPFLIFQKDFWDKCRDETDAIRQRNTGDPNARASRNEVRAALGKMWRDLPEDEKKPYLELTKSIKEMNAKKAEEFHNKMKQYDSDADAFRNLWKEEHPSLPNEEELKIQTLLHKKRRVQ